METKKFNMPSNENFYISHSFYQYEQAQHHFATIVFDPSIYISLRWSLQSLWMPTLNELLFIIFPFERGWPKRPTPKLTIIYYFPKWPRVAKMPPPPLINSYLLFPHLTEGGQNATTPQKYTYIYYFPMWQRMAKMPPPPKLTFI